MIMMVMLIHHLESKNVLVLLQEIAEHVVSENHNLRFPWELCDEESTLFIFESEVSVILPSVLKVILDLILKLKLVLLIQISIKLLNGAEELLKFFDFTKAIVEALEVI